MKYLLILFLFTSCAGIQRNYGFTMPTHPNIKTVTMTRGAANAEFQRLSRINHRTPEEAQRFLEFAQVLLVKPILENQLARAEADLAARADNLPLAVLEAQVESAKLQLANYHPQDSDIVTIYQFE